MPIRFTVTTDPEDLNFIAAAELTGSTGFRHDAILVTALAEGQVRPLAYAVFQNISDAGAEVHFAGTTPGVLRRDVLTGFAAYGFLKLRAPMLTAIIPVENSAAAVAALKGGFRPSGYCNAGVLCLSDAMLLTMKREDCRLLPG